MGNCKGFVDEITTTFGVKSRPRAGLATENDDAAASPVKKIKKTTPSDDFDSTAAVTVAEVVNCSSSEVITGTKTATTSSSDFLASCCSSNENDDRLRKNDVVKDPRIADPEVESGETSSSYNNCLTTSEEKEKARDEGTKSNGEDQFTGKSTARIKRMPSDNEIEEFFVAAERDIHQRFIDKYNFDVVKDVPLEGRYEWVQIKP